MRFDWWFFARLFEDGNMGKELPRSLVDDALCMTQCMAARILGRMRAQHIRSTGGESANQVNGMTLSGAGIHCRGQRNAAQPELATTVLAAVMANCA